MRRLLTIFVILTLSSAEATVSNLTQKLEAIDYLLRYSLEQLNFTGFSVGIVSDGQTVFAKGYGLRNVSEPNSYVTNRTLFSIGSCSKAFTTYTLDSLINKDGLLKWSDPVRDHIPEFRMKKEHSTRCMKVKDLVTHASGLPGHDYSWSYANFSMNEWLKRIPHFEPTYDLREKYQYSNIMYTVGGLVIERVTGQSWEKVVRDRIFQVLNMTHSYTSLEDFYHRNVDDVIAVPYSVPQFPRTAFIAPSLMSDVSVVGPSGSLYSCTEDMTKWIVEQLQLSGPSQEMHIPQMEISTDPAQGGAIAYGLGWGLAFPGGQFMISHSGEIQGFCARVALFPLVNLGVVIFANLDAMTGFNNAIVLQILNIMTGAASTSEAESREWVANQQQIQQINNNRNGSRWDFVTENQRPVYNPQQYVGNFVNRGYGVFRLSQTRTGLIAVFNEVRYIVRARKVPDTFNAVSFYPKELAVTLQFVRDTTGYVTGVLIDAEAALPPLLFEKRVDCEYFTRKYLETFVGTFQNVQSSVTVYINEMNSLSIATDGLDYSGNLKPIKRNWFFWELSDIEFIYNDGAISLFEFNVTANGVVVGVNKHNYEYVEMYEKVVA